MNNKKGFTLIELLAVLVVLAILAVITVPIVTGIINKTRQESYKRSIENYGKKIEDAVAEYQMDHPDEEVPTDIAIYEKEGMLDLKGVKVDCGSDFTIENKKITLPSLCMIDGNYVKYKYVSGNAKELNTEEYEFMVKEINKLYNLGDVVTYKGNEFRVIKDNGSSVTLLKDKPLMYEQTTAYGSTSTYKTNDGYGRVYYKQDNSTNNYDQSDIKKVVDNWSKSELNSTDLVEDSYGYKVRLLKLEEFIEELDYEPKDNVYGIYYTASNDTPEWVECSRDYRGYWTMSPYKDSSSTVWYVGSGGTLRHDNYGVTSNEFVVRPVITILKSRVK